MQVSWPPLLFSSLRATGFAVLQGVVLCNRVDRDVSPATVHGAPAVAVRHEQLQTATVREPQAHGVLHGPALGESLLEFDFCELDFAERVREYVEVDEASSSTRGLRAAVSVSRGL